MNITHILPMERNDMIGIMKIIGWPKRSQFHKSGEETTLGNVNYVKEVCLWLSYAILS